MMSQPWTQRDRCNLSGVVPDDANGRLTVHLSQPDPELLDKLTNLVYPRPDGSPTAPRLPSRCRVPGRTKSPR